MPIWHIAKVKTYYLQDVKGMCAKLGWSFLDGSSQLNKKTKRFNGINLDGNAKLKANKSSKLKANKSSKLQVNRKIGDQGEGEGRGTMDEN